MRIHFKYMQQLLEVSTNGFSTLLLHYTENILPREQDKVIPSTPHANTP